MLEVRKISKVYGEGEARVVALDNVSLRIADGDFKAIMGPSGSGKSTLLNIIGGLDTPSDGEVVLGGKRIDNLDENGLVEIRRGEIAYIFQQYHLLPSLTAFENVILPLLFRGIEGKFGEARRMLARVGLEKRAEHKPSQLSGGEQQRVAIARALIDDPKVLLADEPTGNMDQKTGGEILDLFKQLNKEGRAIVMVTHNPEIAKHAREIIVLCDGRIADRLNNRKENKV